jgi:hypothetical protein
LLSRELTHLLIDPELLEAEKMQTVFQLNGREKTVKILSFTYLEEVLSSATPPDAGVFDALSEMVVQMHVEERMERGANKVHDTRSLGSPNLTVNPARVRHKFGIISRLEKEWDERERPSNGDRVAVNLTIPPEYPSPAESNEGSVSIAQQTILQF